MQLSAMLMGIPKAANESGKGAGSTSPCRGTNVSGDGLVMGSPKPVEIPVKDILKRLQRSSKRQRYVVAVGLATLWMLSIIGTFFCRPVMDLGYLDGGQLLTALCALAMCGSMPLCILLSLPSGSQRLALARIARHADLSVVGPIIDLVDEIQLDDTRKALRRALIRLLPNIKSGDEYLINSRQLHKLNVALDIASKTHPAELQARYCIAVIKAMEHVGDERSLLVVRKLAWRATDNERRARIQSAALDCLPLLESRLHSNRSTGNLLRAAECTLANEKLLHPMSRSNPDAESMLLRSAGKR